MKLECAERAQFSRIATEAIDELFRAKAAYDRAQQKRAENLSALGLVLLKAKGAERAAARALAEHIAAHDCFRRNRCEHAPSQF
jgi:hypothetical protein